MCMNSVLSHLHFTIKKKHCNMRIIIWHFDQTRERKSVPKLDPLLFLYSVIFGTRTIPLGKKRKR